MNACQDCAGDRRRYCFPGPGARTQVRLAGCCGAPHSAPTTASASADSKESRFDKLFAGDRHVQVELTWGIYQRLMAAYRDPIRTGAAGAKFVIDALTGDIPAPLVELRKLGRTFGKRAGDVLAHFYRPRTINGRTEAVNGRLEHLRGLASVSATSPHYISRALLGPGGIRPRLHPAL